MGLRFRKSFKLAPGVRMNFSTSGMGFSFGPRGASVSVGKRGIYGNVGIPGTGLSVREKLFNEGRAARSSPPQVGEGELVSLPVEVGVHDDGEVFFRDKAGNALPPNLVQLAKLQHGNAIDDLIQRKCDEINEAVSAVGDLHLEMPAPGLRPRFTAIPFSEDEPRAPLPERAGFFGRFFRSVRDRVEAANRVALEEHRVAVVEWDNRRVTHLRNQSAEKQLVEQEIYSDIKAMERYLEVRLQSVDWPRETLVDADILDDGKTVFLDVDLPEVEDMPKATAVVPKRGTRLSVKPMSDTQVRRLYMRHIHAVALRLIGETFSALPVAQWVVISGYSQRRAKATGSLADEYLFSARIARTLWETIDFTQAGLAALDVEQTLGMFPHRRDMSKTGIFKPIAPFTVVDHAAGMAAGRP